jgi:hypothetical protein
MIQTQYKKYLIFSKIKKKSKKIQKLTLFKKTTKKYFVFVHTVKS